MYRPNLATDGNNNSFQFSKNFVHVFWTLQDECIHHCYCLLSYPSAFIPSLFLLPIPLKCPLSFLRYPLYQLINNDWPLTHVLCLFLDGCLQWSKFGSGNSFWASNCIAACCRLVFSLKQSKAKQNNNLQQIQRCKHTNNHISAWTYMDLCLML